ncbi:hypothetical protein CSW62_25110 [Caulobacter sp. FWC2]|nr:hypothetical protein CSW62_25110 [Caulobacter sp. FWC2]
MTGHGAAGAFREWSALFNGAGAVRSISKAPAFSCRSAPTRRWGGSAKPAAALARQFRSPCPSTATWGAALGKPVVVNVADKFGRFAAGRYRSDGPSSGQEFREEIAEPALAGGADVVLNMDGMLAFPASFLDEAFGGLVREAIRQGEDAQALIARITIVSSEDPFVAEMARRCMMQAMKNYRP